MAAFIGVGVVGRSRQNGRVSRCSRRRVVRMEADDGGEKKVSPFSEQVDLSTPIKTEFNPGKKSAKEFAEEGIQDEVKSGIRFESITGGIVDDYDPFKEEAKTQKAVEDASEDAMGEIVEVTADGTVTKEILTRGSGPRISPGDTVKLHYTGTLEKGTKFDSSYDRNQPFEVEVGAGSVIKGWDVALPLMRVGEKALLTIQPSFAYGRRGVPPVIPPNATLKFEIEILTVDNKTETETFAQDNPDIPRTPDQIAVAYMDKMAQKDTEAEAKKGFFEKFYFISPFKSQTGERPPWWLNPNITFVIVFAVVGAAFYVVVQNGGVHQGYVSTPVDVNPFTD